jgi:phospholipid/cholesterol/gamma-HCH transport system substrate-binding protein
MKRAHIETAVGIFVFMGILCVGYLTIKLGKIEWIGEKHYPVYARFQSVSGLLPGAHVEMAGVKIGKVDFISLDPESQLAVVKMKLLKDVVLTEDVIASVTTGGLIGDKYIKLSPGASERVLKPGDLITETESAVNLEELISKYVFGGV